MANTKSASKRARQSAARALRNRTVRSQLRTLQRRARTSAQPSGNEIHQLISAIDKAAKRGVIHRNTADRRKSRLHKLMAGPGKK